MAFEFFSSRFALLLPFFFSSLVVMAVPTNYNKLQSVSQQENVTFTLFATDMSGCDSTSACDLYVAINCAFQNTDWQPCGKTSKRQDDNFPVWPEVFTFEHTQGTSQRWRFDLMDVNVAFDDLIGSIEIDMDEYASAPGNLYISQVPGNTGSLWIQRKR